jgi:hypothetical protein
MLELDCEKTRNHDAAEWHRPLCDLHPQIEQSAEQLQEVDHPEARIAHRGICASPDAIFGSH